MFSIHVFKNIGKLTGVLVVRKGEEVQAGYIDLDDLDDGSDNGRDKDQEDMCG